MNKTTFTQCAWHVFERAVKDYHTTNNVDTPCPNPYEAGSVEHDLYRKCWIDAVQWHLEDLIRNPQIDPVDALALKRRIDRSNQDRTDLVEEIDSYLRTLYADVSPLPSATLNTESPAWAIDRLSILALKIWHMEEQTQRLDAPSAHIAMCRGKLDVLREQQRDLCLSIQQLLDDIAQGRKYMKVYRQMKMYNDPAYKTDPHPNACLNGSK